MVVFDFEEVDSGAQLMNVETIINSSVSFFIFVSQLKCSKILISTEDNNGMILHIETATSTCSVALSKEGKMIHAVNEAESNMHTKRLNLMIDELLRVKNLTINDLTAISVSIGPGSYTGLRVGLGAAKGLAFGLNIPIIGINTLQSLAYPFKNENPKTVISAIDARRNEVYLAIFNSEIEHIKENHCLIIEEGQYPADWPDPQKLIVCGNGAEKIAQLLDNFDFEHHITACLAENQVELAYKRYISSDFDDLAYLKPDYLKPPNITQSKKSLL